MKSQVENAVGGAPRGCGLVLLPRHLENRDISTLCPRQKPGSPRGDRFAQPERAALSRPGLGDLLELAVRAPASPPRSQVPGGINASFAPVLPGSLTWELQPGPTLVPRVLLKHHAWTAPSCPGCAGEGGVPSKRYQSTCFKPKVPGEIHRCQSWKMGYCFRDGKAEAACPPLLPSLCLPQGQWPLK